MERKWLRGIFHGAMHVEWIGSLLDQLGVRSLIVSAIGSAGVMLWHQLTGSGGIILTAVISFVAIYLFVVAVRFQLWFSQISLPTLLEPGHSIEGLPFSDTLAADDVKLRDEIEAFYKSHMAPLSIMLDDHVAKQLVRANVEWEGTEGLFHTVADYIGLYRRDVTVTMESIIETQHGSIREWGESLYAVVDEYCSRYVLAMRLSAAMPPVKITNEIKEATYAMYAELRQLLAKPESRELYRTLNYRMDSWRRQLE